MGIPTTGRKDVARREADASFQRATEELAALQTFGELQPEHEAAEGRRHSGSRREGLLDDPSHLTDVLFKDASNPTQMTVVSAGSEEVGERGLRQRGA